MVCSRAVVCVCCINRQYVVRFQAYDEVSLLCVCYSDGGTPGFFVMCKHRRLEGWGKLNLQEKWCRLAGKSTLIAFMSTYKTAEEVVDKATVRLSVTYCVCTICL